MPIREFLDDEPFDAETIKSMSESLAAVLKVLSIVKGDDRIIVIAKRIIQLAREGEHDPERLKSAVLRELRH